ncbi:GTP cyclohydrolase II [Cellulomonas flavigena DSM 20109]|uniref:GTP cyclohydrolase-2 n=1 Tax=Cellulomonas flavigena (strain ATCC 482 / DSM 20109 / BCRC 11376 / JCM 18109 / NBRC 3775 / NCIMB 8073 / NRS 134) TaxID=446466 RepID=D5UEU7_CELFN|nr:bifunctional 3,4-dihydroxy-2-butanone-4-phosphate synthase/GTP cyclohydrolase II [Cellulomonas flavigena]ADG74757.1 GTP cyclohydrolase II [Cellulomonas flavigena DSM 20109]
MSGATDQDVRLGTVEDALEALRAGRPVIVADSQDREDEADVVLAAQSATPEWVAWTIRHSSGYLCAPMPAERADALDLPLMVPHSQDPRRTAYTVTVDATTGVSTGISAADRTRTLHVLADPGAGRNDLIRPGHVLPLRAVPGGVLHRAGHTEAAVDLCRLAGLEPVAGIAELVRDDGQMVRLPEASRLAEDAGLVLLTIADLRAWRAQHDPVEPVASAAAVAPRVHATHTAHLPTRHGDFRIHGFRDLRTGDEHVALVSTSGLAEVPAVRVHSECLTGDAFGSARCDCGPQLDAALEITAAEGGAVVYLRGHEGRGIGLLAKVAAYALQDDGRDTVEANVDLGWPADRREYGAAAAILAELGVRRVELLTNNPAKVAGLRAHGIDVAQVRGLEVGRTPHNEAYLRTKATSMGHALHLDEPDGAPQLAPAVHVDPVLAGPAPAGADTTDHLFDPLEELA